MAHRGVLAGWLLVQSSISIFAGGPDLVVWGPSTRPFVDYITFSSTSCEVREGCGTPGRRRVLRFETETRNIGTADLVFGNPVLNPLFVYDPCHNHYHFGQFAEYRLLDQSGALVVEGKKIGFCLEDVLRWDPSANSQAIYNCLYQGIQHGWADVYPVNVPCQLIDITDVPPGDYILDITVDPSNFIPELDENNNNTRVPVQIPPDCSVPPPNDALAAAQTIGVTPQVIYSQNTCATKEPGERNHAGNAGGASVWYRWTSPFSRQITISTEGSGFDTLLAAYRYSGGVLSLMAENDDIAPGVIEQSEIRFQATTGTEYRIVVDGYNGAFGSIVLNMDPPANDDFASCQTISGASGSVLGHNIGATHEAGEPAHASTFGAHSVWYCWTAPRDGVAEWSTIGSDFDTTLAIYTGSNVGQLTATASDNDSGGGGGTSVVRFNASSNTMYHMAIDGRGNAMGNISLAWQYLTARLSIDRNANGTLTLTLRGADGTYTLRASSTLTNWTDLGTITVTNGRGTLAQPNDTPLRFYNAVLPTP